MNKIIFLVDSFISQLPILATAFKYYKFYWLNNQEKVCHENELDQFHSHNFIFFYKYSTILSSNLM
jgi:hypothetical protein